METTRGTLLGGRVSHLQPCRGHRTGIEPVLLAASIPARRGDLVLEGGTGSGAGLLCLGARVPGLRGIGVERDPAMAALAQANAAANGVDAMIVAADLLGWRAGRPVDHAFANPPWHDPAGAKSSLGAKEAARRAVPGGLFAWTVALAGDLRPRGTLTLIVSAAGVPECLAGLAAGGCGSACLMPLWPRAGVPARLALLRGVRGGRAPFRIAAGLALHPAAGSGFTEAAEAILREAAALAF